MAKCQLIDFEEFDKLINSTALDEFNRAAMIEQSKKIENSNILKNYVLYYKIKQNNNNNV